MVQDVILEMSPMEKANYNQQHFIDGYLDISGRIGYLRRLWEDGVIVCLRVPFDYERNQKMRTWLRKYGLGEMPEREKPDAFDESAWAATDALAEEMSKPKPALRNPLWDHFDDIRRKETPQDTLISDEVVLSSNVENIVDGARVQFTIYDISQKPPKKIDQIIGKVEGGRAKVNWIVPESSSEAQPKYEFEATYEHYSSGRQKVPFTPPVICEFVEMPDVLFNHGSAVPCLDPKGVLVGSLAATFIYANEFPDKEIILFGHADTSGDHDYNYNLSQWRAEGVKAILDNDKELWLDIVDLASKVEDFQMILKSLTVLHGWSCNPGKVDNKLGPKTQSGLKSFQAEYNERFGESISIDGRIGPQTWTAMMFTIRSLIEELTIPEIGSEQLPQLQYGYENKGVYACGEAFPIDESGKEEYRSKENRRVEIVFSEKGKTPKLTAPSDTKKIKKSEVPMYDKKRVEKRPLQSRETVLSDVYVISV